MWRIGWAPNSIPIYIQQDATLHNLFISGNCSTCFGWYFYPSSGAHSIVSTASGICHTGTAIWRYRGRAQTGSSSSTITMSITNHKALYCEFLKSRNTFPLLRCKHLLSCFQHCSLCRSCNMRGHVYFVHGSVRRESLSIIVQQDATM
jgi:hypothetical protein